jgi:hypothetical protein
MRSSSVGGKKLTISEYIKYNETKNEWGIWGYFMPKTLLQKKDITRGSFDNTLKIKGFVDHIMHTKAGIPSPTKYGKLVNWCDPKSKVG